MAQAISIKFTHYYKGKVQKNVKVKQKKKVNGRWVTRYVTKKKTVYENRSRSVTIPVTPESMPSTRTANYDDLPTLRKKTHTRRGAYTGRTMTWTSFFPARNYRFLQVNKVENPVKLARWFDERLLHNSKIRVRIPALYIDNYYDIRSFEWDVEGGTSDIRYSITIQEEYNPKIKTKTIK